MKHRFAKDRCRTLLRRYGWEIHRFDPNHSLEAFLWVQLSHLEVDCVIDVGGHRGEYGLFLRSLGYTGPIVSVEPSSDSRRFLEEVAAEDPNWRVVPYALGDVSGSATLNLTASSDMTSIRTPNKRGILEFSASVVDTEMVEVCRLDDVFDDLVRGAERVYLKMDTQGYDINVFRGLGNARDRVVALQTEISIQPLYDDQPDYLNVISEIANEGYAPSGMFIVTRDKSSRLIEMDAVMVRPRAAE